MQPSPTGNRDAFAPPSSGLPATVAIGLGAVLFPVLAVINYQIGASLIRQQRFWWPAMNHHATLLALAFSAAVMLIGFWYYMRPERRKMFRGTIGIVLGASATFYIVWALALLAMGAPEIGLLTPEVQLLILGVVAVGAGTLIINVPARTSIPPPASKLE